MSLSVTAKLMLETAIRKNNIGLSDVESARRLKRLGSALFCKDRAAWAGAQFEITRAPH